MEKTIYHTIYNKLQRLIPNLDRRTEPEQWQAKSESTGYMDLHLDYVSTDGSGNMTIALSQYYRENGDMVPDPDMQIRVYPELKVAEALTYQDRWAFQEIYETHDEKVFVRPKLKKDLNDYLNGWLTNCIEQDHRFPPVVIEKTKAEQQPRTHESPDQKESIVRRDGNDSRDPSLSR